MFQLRRNRVLVVLVLMSIFVVTTQAFSVTSEPVIVDWQYDAWGDSNLVLSGETSNQVEANSVTFSFTLTNSGALDETGTVVRVELVDVNGDRVAITGQANTNPDDDSQWLVATEQTITDSPFGQDAVWSSGNFAFIDAKVDDIISAGGKFAIYTSNRNSMTSYDKIHADVTPTFAAPFRSVIHPSAFTDINSRWNLEGQAYDNNNATSSDESQSRIANDIYFLTWNNTDKGTISQVDIHIYMDLVGLSNDYCDFVVYVSGVSTTPTHQITSANGGTTLHIKLENVAGPGGTWDWTEIGLLDVRLDGTQSAGPDAVADYEVFEVWGVVTGT